ncbi:MAG TPA: PEGA domain-containing protein [Oligoflexia bacterium]|nr:PEGA domain-containing protein [Oligoflexia bacterium]
MRGVVYSAFILIGSILTLGVLVSGCGGHGRALIVKSEPGDAEVCIKGKAGSEYFHNQKSCVGTTPFEAHKVKALNPDGERHDVKFSSVEGDRESFYVVVSRPGYVSEVLEVPGKAGEWDFNLFLKSEQAAAAAQVAAVHSRAPVIPISVSPTEPHPANAQPQVGLGTVRVTSDPVGALVYINGGLRGNTPFTHEGRGGESIQIKLELDGYRPVEKNFTLESQKNFVINFRLQSTADGASAAIVEPVVTPVASPVKNPEPNKNQQ